MHGWKKAMAGARRLLPAAFRTSCAAGRDAVKAHVERAELAGESDLFALAQRLIAKHQHRMAVHQNFSM
jgi:hypothetical protein